MYQSHSSPSRSYPPTTDAAKPTSTDAAKLTSNADSNTATELNSDAAINPHGPWVYDTITAAEYEAQLKAKAQSGSNPAEDPAAKAAADAYFDKFSDEDIDQMVVSEMPKKPDAVGNSTIEPSQNAEMSSYTVTNAVLDPENHSAANTTPNPEYQAASIAEAESVAGPVKNSINDAESNSDSNPFAAAEFEAEINKTTVVVDDAVSDSVSIKTSTDDTVTNVVKAPNSLWTPASITDLSAPVLLAVSLGLLLAIMLLIWKFGKLLSWYSQRREIRFLQQSPHEKIPTEMSSNKMTSYAQQSSPVNTMENGVGDSLKNEMNLRAKSEPHREIQPELQPEPSKQGSKRNVGFKKVEFHKRENQSGAETASPNALLESELLNAQESLALVKANSKQRDSELQAKVRGLNEQLSAQTDIIAKLESDLRSSAEGNATAQVTEDNRATELLSEVERLKEELGDKTATITKLESEFIASKEALATAQAQADKGDEEISAFSAAQAKEDKRTTELLSEVERLKEKLSIKTTAFYKLESDFLTSKETLVAAQADADKRAKELLFDLETFKR